MWMRESEPGRGLYFMRNENYTPAYIHIIVQCSSSVVERMDISNRIFLNYLSISIYLYSFADWLYIGRNLFRRCGFTQNMYVISFDRLNVLRWKTKQSKDHFDFMEIGSVHSKRVSPLPLWKKAIFLNFSKRICYFNRKKKFLILVCKTCADIFRLKANFNCTFNLWKKSNAPHHMECNRIESLLLYRFEQCKTLPSYRTRERESGICVPPYVFGLNVCALRKYFSFVLLHSARSQS